MTALVRVVRTYLQLASFGHLRRGAPADASARLVRVPAGTVAGVAEWRRLYATVGAPYHWHDRDAWSDNTLAQHLARSDVRAFRVQVLRAGSAIATGGFLELQAHHDGSVEIVYLGLHSQAQGVGLGRWLVTEAVDEARRMGATGVWLHTCTLDGVAALPNYLARGFTVTRTEEYDARVHVEGVQHE